MLNEFSTKIGYALSELTLSELTSMHFLESGSIIFSFDKDYSPFLCLTSGFNWPGIRKELDKPFPTPLICKEIKRNLLSFFNIFPFPLKSRKGGRIFIECNNCKFYSDFVDRRIHFCDFIWPAGVDLYKVLVEMRDTIIRRKRETSKNPKSIKKYIKKSEYLKKAKTK